MDSDSTCTVFADTPEETKRLAETLATCLHPGDVVVLTGDLGAGKTSFVQGIAQGLGLKDHVTSPTFNILVTYENDVTSLHHFDLYRLEDEEELDDIGYYEVLEDGGVSCVEWAEKFPECLPDDYLHLTFTICPDDTRKISAVSEGDRSDMLLDAWREEL
ncbi:MAG: tRNA (adenosine(37)-N6)-threonylcarbamoyltransferase complex ATPase subunit type 1 TsaE [Coriobacteriia bacterium]|nr:tRNA (adenosine(37)-N6)-threonylcarbamoyltransferase complex ATPase subunit type 1 TsaE [Coriobacteriia bacterium]